MMGLIPGLRAPTANWSTTIGLALVVFVSTHVFGIKEKGILKYLSEFIGPAWYLAIITIPINIIDHLARVLSLSLRLFANMMAKHCILTLLALTLIILSAKPVLLLQTLGIPVMLLPIVMGLGIITCFIQAFIFTLLSLIYISEATTLEEKH
jgi:F-type H+-transporting ATPase subunit a